MRLNTALRVILILLSVVLGTFAAAWYFGGTEVSSQGITLSFSARPALRGSTEIDLSPLGRVSASTHHFPFRLQVNVKQVEPEMLSSQLIDQDQETAFDHWKTVLKNGLICFGVRQIVVGFLGGAAIAWLLWRLRLRQVLVAGAVGAVLIGGFLAGTALGYRADAFKEPRFSGPVAMAPGLVKIVTESLPRFNELKGQTVQVVNSIGMLFSGMEDITALASPGETEEARKILLVSDLHSNPVGVEFIKKLCQHFQIDFIINAGDLTDFGSSLENAAVEGLKNLGRPQLFVPGNHDSDQTIRFMASMPGTRVLDGVPVTLQGLSILGIPDQQDFVFGDSQEKEAELERQVESAKSILSARDGRDILVVHNDRVAECLAGEAPLIVTGHSHELALTVKNGSVIINPGTCGAAGLRGFYAEKGIGYSAVVVYLPAGGKPLAADIIHYDPAAAQFHLERRVLDRDGASHQNH